MFRSLPGLTLLLLLGLAAWAAQRGVQAGQEIVAATPTVPMAGGPGWIVLGDCRSGPC